MYPNNILNSQNVHLKPIENDSLRKRIIEKFVQWLESSSSHGLPNIVRTNRISLKILWLVFFIGSIGACGYFFITSLILYFQYNTLVQISVVKDNPAEFPAVTFCNLIPFNLNDPYNQFYISNLLLQTNNSIIENFSKNPYGNSYSSLSDDICQYYGTNNTNDILYDITESLKRLIANDTTIWFKEDIGFNIDSMLVSCSFNRNPCNSLNFKRFFNYDYGNCYTFNTGENKYGDETVIYETDKTGSNFGLQLELLIGDPSTPIKYTPNTGVYLIVHNATKKSITLGDGDGIYVPPGFDTIVSVKREFHSKLGSPYSNCIKDLSEKKKLKTTKYIDYLIDLNFTKYDEGFCYKLCYQNYVIDYCSCANPKYPKLLDSVYCLNKTQLDCLNFVSKTYSIKLNPICVEGCPIQCDTIKYELSTSMAQYPTVYYSNFLKSRKESFSKFNTNSQAFADEVKKYLLKVTITYNELEYLLINESPAITSDSLIGTIGGQFGLFIGISLLSVIEIIEIIIELFSVYIQNRL